MDFALEVSNKYSDNILAQFIKIFQWLGVCWVEDIWNTLIIDGEKVLNMFKVIVDQSFTNWRSTLQSNYIGNNVLQIFPGLFACKRHIAGNIKNWTKVGKSGWPRKSLTRSVGLIYWSLQIRKISSTEFQSRIQAEYYFLGKYDPQLKLRKITNTRWQRRILDNKYNQNFQFWMPV